ncbi:hypothetical protein KKB43_00950 [Patescibacteria group bacterium]|nr:hypothetical protein [Patescibacteria group bacterium]MBU4141886.1 hypothetical protein [Patescibacteria group bacterium]MBU4339188.1 hypothetical protein [Patescibacteria group bacterium]MBU4579565.1 hypothetical protein [Patescibacteria group bacterium]
MTLFGRIFRKLLFGGIFLFFIAGFSYYVFKAYFPTLPTCVDNIQNQGEDGVDCGNVCNIECLPSSPPDDTKPIEVAWARVINSDAGVYDLAAKIINSNLYWGVAEFKYDFVARDSNGNVVIEKSGSSYLLPDTYDYIIIPSIKTDKIPVNPAELNIIKEGQKWASVSSVYNNLSLSLSFREKRYVAKNENGLPSVSAILTNATTYDFDKIDIKVVLFDENNEPVAVNVSDRRTMRSGEEQLFRLFWNTALQQEVFNTDFKATTNIFDSQNFMSRFGTGDKIREYR